MNRQSNHKSNWIGTFVNSGNLWRYPALLCWSKENKENTNKGRKAPQLRTSGSLFLPYSHCYKSTQNQWAYDLHISIYLHISRSRVMDQKYLYRARLRVCLLSLWRVFTVHTLLYWFYSYQRVITNYYRTLVPAVSVRRPLTEKFYTPRLISYSQLPILFILQFSTL